jgi:hypothetical protein
MRHDTAHWSETHLFAQQISHQDVEPCHVLVELETIKDPEPLPDGRVSTLFWSTKLFRH